MWSRLQEQQKQVIQNHDILAFSTWLRNKCADLNGDNSIQLIEQIQQPTTNSIICNKENRNVRTILHKRYAPCVRVLPHATTGAYLLLRSCVLRAVSYHIYGGMWLMIFDSEINITKLPGAMLSQTVTHSK